ncbi:MAG: hypothetical protein NZ659_07580 [Acidimicrobiales bacterium]|nr:hypothetical protein [Acidimicrobiales bacterium]
MSEQEPSSVNMFHGPNAEEMALEAAERYGRILACLGTEKGVRKDDSREMLRIHNMPPASDALGSVVIGPMDLATFEAADALLRVVEEPSAYTKPFLWANDIGGVPKTIRSRCHCIWSYGPHMFETEIDDALVDQAIEGCGIATAELLTKHPPKDVLDATIARLAIRGVPPRMWAIYKATLGNESISSVAAALAGGKE